MSDSFCWPNFVPVTVLKVFSFCIVLELTASVCGVNVICVSYVIPSILGVLLRGICSSSRVM